MRVIRIAPFVTVLFLALFAAGDLLAQQPIESAVLSTACKRIKVFNNGRLGGNTPDASLDYIDECDTFNVNTRSDIYLWDAAPFVSYVKDSDTLIFTSLLGRDIDNPRALIPITPLMVDSLSFDSYTYATSELATADSAIGLIQEIYVPKHPDTCEFIYQRFSFWKRKPVQEDGLGFGILADWNIPSDSVLHNTGDELGYPIYQQGVEYDQDGPFEEWMEFVCGYAQQSNDRLGSLAPNFTFSTANSYGHGEADLLLPGGDLSDSLMREVIYERSGYYLYLSREPFPEMIRDWVSFYNYEILPLYNDTLCFSIRYISVRDGIDGLNLTISESNNFIDNHDLECRYPNICCTVPGDANNNGAYGISDPVYIINNIFKGGPYPACCQTADCNGDGYYNIADAVLTINLIFKGGPGPVCNYKMNPGSLPCYERE